MEAVGRREAPIFTWNPVEQMWVQENQVASKPPPAPHDVHAIQTWFLDPDENEWIQTVLGPMGRRLAERWHGAYRVPESAVVPKVKPSTRGHRGQLSYVLGGIVLLALVGGIALAAPNFTATPATSAPPSATDMPVATPAATAPPVATPPPTAEPTPEPTPVRTVAPPPTPRPVPRPSGPTQILADGTQVIYTGPASAARGGFLPASFSVIRPGNRPGAGSFAIILDSTSIANRRVVTGALNSAGQIALDVPTNVTAGPYTLMFSYAGDTRAITTVSIR